MRLQKYLRNCVLIPFRVRFQFTTDAKGVNIKHNCHLLPCIHQKCALLPEKP